MCPQGEAMFSLAHRLAQIEQRLAINDQETTPPNAKHAGTGRKRRPVQSGLNVEGDTQTNKALLDDKAKSIELEVKVVERDRLNAHLEKRLEEKTTESATKSARILDLERNLARKTQDQQQTVQQRLDTLCASSQDFKVQTRRGGRGRTRPHVNAAAHDQEPVQCPGPPGLMSPEWQAWDAKHRRAKEQADRSRASERPRSPAPLIDLL
ncbi:hypothetical protein LTR95_014814 [Oleoguttula sp. CCFEE 5521]